MLQLMAPQPVFPRTFKQHRTFLQDQAGGGGDEWSQTLSLLQNPNYYYHVSPALHT